MISSDLPDQVRTSSRASFTGTSQVVIEGWVSMNDINVEILDGPKFGGSLWGGLSRLLKAFRQEYVGLAQTLGAQRCSLPIDRPEHEDGNE